MKQRYLFLCPLNTISTGSNLKKGISTFGNSRQNHNAKQSNLAPTAGRDLDASTLSPTPSGQNLRAFPRVEELSWTRTGWRLDAPT